MTLGCKLIYHKEAIKYIAKQDKIIQERIVLGLKGLLEIPPKGDIKRMKGHSGLYRLRIGTYRILFRIDHSEKVIYIQSIASRSDAYK